MELKAIHKLHGKGTSVSSGQTFAPGKLGLTKAEVERLALRGALEITKKPAATQSQKTADNTDE